MGVLLSGLISCEFVLLLCCFMFEFIGSLDICCKCWIRSLSSYQKTSVMKYRYTRYISSMS